LPAIFGIGLGLALEWLRTVMGDPLRRGARVLIPAMAVAAFAVVAWKGYQDFLERAQIRDRERASRLLALEMLRASPENNRDLIARYEAEIAAGEPGWRQYLIQKYSPLGSWTGRLPNAIFAFELVLAGMGGWFGTSLARRHPSRTMIEPITVVSGGSEGHSSVLDSVRQHR
jgi:hypothetical protein